MVIIIIGQKLLLFLIKLVIKIKVNLLNMLKINKYSIMDIETNTKNILKKISSKKYPQKNILKKISSMFKKK